MKFYYQRNDTLSKPKITELSVECPIEYSAIKTTPGFYCWQLRKIQTTNKYKPSYSHKGLSLRHSCFRNSNCIFHETLYIRESKQIAYNKNED